MKRSAVRTGGLVLVLAGLFAPAPPAEAQVRRQEARQRLEQQVRERFDALLREELGIDETETGAVQAVVEEFRVERLELGARQSELRRRLGSSGSLLDEDAAREVLDELVAVQRAEVDLLAREQEALLELLSPPQVVRFYTLRERFAERVRTLRGGPPGRRRGGGGGPASWPGGDALFD